MTVDTAPADERFNVLVGVVPVRDGSILLLQRSEREKFMPGAWGLPAGKINFGERLEEAVSRELKEECGLAGDVVRMTGYSMFMSVKDGVRLHNLQINFLVEVIDGEVTLDHSNQAYRWVSADDLTARSTLDDFTAATIDQAIG